MYSALYYPHTTVQNTHLLRTALLFWDELHYIVPFEGFSVQYPTPEFQEAIELIGKARVPSREEKTAAHDLIEDFVTRPLPSAFKYAADLSRSAYEMYPQKLMGSTWRLLRDASLVGQPLPNADYPSTSETGLSVMSILADCCAGSSLTRVTDQSAAYAVVAGALVDEDAAAVEVAQRELLPIPLEVASLDGIPLRKLLDMRKNEVKHGPSAGTTGLRHNLIDDVNKHAKKLAAAKTATDRVELKRQYKQELQVNLAALREALKLESTAVIGSKEILAAVLGGVAAVATVGLDLAVPVGVPGSIVAIGGLLGMRAKFARTRSAMLEKYPMAYLYEAGGAAIRY